MNIEEMNNRLKTIEADHDKLMKLEQQNTVYLDELMRMMKETAETIDRMKQSAERAAKKREDLIGFKKPYKWLIN